MDNNSGFISCDKLDRVANWVGTNMASAFFASLERCSCINLSTADNENEEYEDAHDRPLVLPNPNPNPNPIFRTGSAPDPKPPADAQYSSNPNLHP